MPQHHTVAAAVAVVSTPTAATTSNSSSTTPNSLYVNHQVLRQVSSHLPPQQQQPAVLLNYHYPSTTPYQQPYHHPQHQQPLLLQQQQQQLYYHHLKQQQQHHHHQQQQPSQQYRDWENTHLENNNNNIKEKNVTYYPQQLPQQRQQQQQPNFYWSYDSVDQYEVDDNHDPDYPDNPAESNSIIYNHSKSHSPVKTKKKKKKSKNSKLKKKKKKTNPNDRVIVTNRSTSIGSSSSSNSGSYSNQYHRRKRKGDYDSDSSSSYYCCCCLGGSSHDAIAARSTHPEKAPLLSSPHLDGLVQPPTVVAEVDFHQQPPPATTRPNEAVETGQEETEEELEELEKNIITMVMISELAFWNATLPDAKTTSSSSSSLFWPWFTGSSSSQVSSRDHHPNTRRSSPTTTSSSDNVVRTSNVLAPLHIHHNHNTSSSSSSSFPHQQQQTRHNIFPTKQQPQPSSSLAVVDHPFNITSLPPTSSLSSSGDNMKLSALSTMGVSASTTKQTDTNENMYSVTSSSVNSQNINSSNNNNNKQQQSWNSQNNNNNSHNAITSSYGSVKERFMATLAYDPEIDDLDVNQMTWKQATDPNTGRSYYYDTVTRKTQWEKPREIRLLEKKKKRDQKRADLEFFDTMEKNLYHSIQRGDLIPNYHTSSSKAISPSETNPSSSSLSSTTAAATSPSALSSSPNSSTNYGKVINGTHHSGMAGLSPTNLRYHGVGSNSPVISSKTATQLPINQPGNSNTNNNKAPTKVRTISGMDRHVIEQLSGHYSTTGNSTSTNTLNSSSTNVGQSSVVTTTTASSSSSVKPSNSRGILSTASGNNGITTTPLAVTPTSTNLLNSSEGGPRRPPLAQRRVSSGTQPLASMVNSSSSSNITTTPVTPIPQQPSLLNNNKIVKNPNAASASTARVLQTMDSLSLSPEWSNPFSAATTTTTSTDVEILRGVDLLVEDDAGVAGPTNQDAQTEMGGGQRPTAATTSSATATTHIRRNTGNTTFFDTTMQNPNIDATMQCVCGVYRAHIVQYVEKFGNTSMGYHNKQNIDNNIDIFRDDYEQLVVRQQQQQARGSRAQVNDTSTVMNIPTLADIKAFYNEFYQRSQMEHDTIIMSLIYVERLVKQTGGVLVPNPYNWKSILFSCMILASKVWDDLSMWNIDFSNVSVAAASSPSTYLLSAFSLQRINQLELAVLTNLHFRTAIPASEYAKYYFLIRTMLIRSGLVLGGNTTNISSTSTNTKNSNTALLKSNDNDALLTQIQQEEREVENRTNHYQQLLNVSNPSKTRRAVARSVDWNSKFGINSSSSSSSNDNVVPQQNLTMPSMYQPISSSSSSTSSNAMDSGSRMATDIDHNTPAATTTNDISTYDDNRDNHDDNIAMVDDDDDIDPILGPDALLLQEVTATTTNSPMTVDHFVVAK